LLDKVIAETSGKEVNGAKAYDTFGFPIDLTALILRERGLDEAGFDKAMQEQNHVLAQHQKFQRMKILVEGNTESFVGYDQVENEVKSLVFVK
jgi:alanyl-tRNA synthetase